MNTALDNCISSIPVEVNASMYPNQSISTKEQRFTCPICGEYVYLAKNGVFGHKDRTDESDYCERRVDSSGNFYSLQYRVGLPLYIRKNTISNTYELKVGFPAIPYDILKIAAEAEVTISDRANIQKTENFVKYKLDRFSSSETTFCVIDFVPENGKSYSVNKSKFGYYLDKYISNYADGFLNNSAIFTYHSNGEGRKIHKGDTIEANTDYILVTSNNINENGIEIERIGKLKLRYFNGYNVYRIRFSDHNEVIYNHLVAFCHDNFRVTLVRKKPELLPLWPPTIQMNNRYEIINGDKDSVCAAVLPSNAQPKIYKHFDLSFTEYEVTKTDSVNYVNIDCSSNCVITISKVYSLDSFYFKKAAYKDMTKHIGHEPIFQGADLKNNTIEITAASEIECFINKGYILTGIYNDKTIDIKHNRAELAGLNDIILNRYYENRRIPIKKYIIPKNEATPDLAFDFQDNPLEGCIVPITPAAVTFLRQHYDEIRNKEYFRKIIITGKISLDELKRIYYIIDKGKEI